MASGYRARANVFEGEFGLAAAVVVWERHGQDWARRKTYRNTTAVTPAKA
jgi:hypothetical protein